VLINLRQLPGANCSQGHRYDTGSPLVGVLVSISLDGGNSVTQSTNIDGKVRFHRADARELHHSAGQERLQTQEVSDIAILAERTRPLNLVMEPLRTGDTASSRLRHGPLDDDPRSVPHNRDSRHGRVAEDQDLPGSQRAHRQCTTRRQRRQRKPCWRRRGGHANDGGPPRQAIRGTGYEREEKRKVGGWPLPILS